MCECVNRGHKALLMAGKLNRVHNLGINFALNA